VEESVGVEAAGEPDERVDGCEDEDDGECVFPERDADERAPRR
jgi:hypothetical protein